MSRLYFLLCVLASTVAKGQIVDSVRTIQLTDVVISGDLLKTAEIGLSEDRIDSIQIQSVNGMSLADMFRTIAGAQIRSYGSNGISTPSFRGTGGNHTAILWNGINLQSPLSGMQDLSLVPMAFIDQLSVQKGGSSSIYGSGAIGGTIQLRNHPKFEKGLSIETTQQLGSFGNYFQSYKVSLGTKTFYNSTSIFSRTIDNDYPYINQYVNPVEEEIRSNAGFDQWGFMQQNDWRIGKFNLVGIKLWYQYNDLEVPAPIISSSSSEAFQNDEFVRGILNWSRHKETWSIEYKSSMNLHTMTFAPLEGDSANNDYLTWVNRLTSTIDFSKQSALMIGVNHAYNRAEVDAFGPEVVTQNISALFSSFQTSVFNDRFNTSINVRQEFVEGEAVPLTPSLGLEMRLSKRLTVRSSISRNYRIPTLNELYWLSSGAMGNRDLKSEESFNTEFGIELMEFGNDRWTFSGTGTVYHSKVDNWVQWQESNDVWSPINLKEVWSRGIEGKASVVHTSHELQAQLDASYSFTKTTNDEVFDSSQNTVGNQLPYTPLHDLSVFLSGQMKEYSATLSHSFTSQQYTEAENRTRFAMDGYHVTNVSINYLKDWNKISASIGMRVNNAFDTSYENRRGYPMYGRNFLLELKLRFNN